MPQAPTYRKCILHVQAHGHLAIRIAWPPHVSPGPRIARLSHSNTFLISPLPPSLYFISFLYPSLHNYLTLYCTTLGCVTSTKYLAETPKQLRDHLPWLNSIYFELSYISRHTKSLHSCILLVTIATPNNKYYNHTFLYLQQLV